MKIFVFFFCLILSAALGAPVLRTGARDVSNDIVAGDINAFLRIWSADLAASMEPSESTEIPEFDQLNTVSVAAIEIPSKSPYPSKIAFKVPDASITPFTPLDLHLRPSASVYVVTPRPSEIPPSNSAIPPSKSAIPPHPPAIKPEPSVLPEPSPAGAHEGSVHEIPFSSPEESLLPTSLPSPSGSVIPDDTNSKKDAACLPADAQVRRQDGTILNVRDLQIGDHVEVDTGIFAPIIAWTHKRSDVETFMVEITTDAHGDTGRIATSPGHFFLVDGYWVAARELEIGTKLHGNSITSIRIKRKSGLFNPQTASGFLLARTGGIISEFIQVTTYTEAVHPMIAHGALSVVRACPSIFSHIPLFLAELSVSLKSFTLTFSDLSGNFLGLLVESLVHSAF